MTVSIRTEFAARINEVRRSQHLSISDVAKLANVPRATAQGWLNGRHLPTPALRAQYLGMVDRLGLAAEVPEGLWLDEWARIEPRLRSGQAPYVGLRAFRTSEVEYYYGREAEARRKTELQGRGLASNEETETAKGASEAGAASCKARTTESFSIGSANWSNSG